MIEVFINRFLEQIKADKYSLESISISSNIKLKPNEVIFIDNYAGSNFQYFSSDEFFDSDFQNRITQNLGFIRFLTGTAILQGLKLTITKYKEETEKPTLTIQTDKEGFIKNIKI